MARIPDDLRRSRRRLLLGLAIGVGAIALVFGALSGFYIDILWFREVGFSTVFWTRFWSRLLLGAIFGAAFFALLYANLLLVRRLRPRYRVFSPEEEIVERYRAAFEPYAKWVLPGISLFFGVLAGVSIAGAWESFQLYRAADGVSFGMADPVFGRDASFYVLSLPFQKLVQAWIFGSLVTITVVCAAAHYLWGGIRLRAMTERVTPQVKAHLSVLLGLIVLTKAWGYRLGQFDLLTSERGVVTGASYTDINAHLPALKLLVVIAILCSILFLINIRFRGWALPVAGLGLLVVASVVAGGLWPALVQRLSVAPQELQRETPFIERNIELTRFAYGIDEVETREFAAEPAVTPEEIEGAGQTIENIRLWNPTVLRDSYRQLQRIRPYYSFEDVDVDRYEVDGQLRTVMIAPREIRQSEIPEGGRTWQNEHLFYTHGYGAIASRVDQATATGSPRFVLQDIPPTGPLATELTEPAIYFQEQADVDFVVTGSDTEEFDFPHGETGGQELAQYTGEGGIEVGGFLRRLSFAWQFRDVNLLISGLINEDSRMLINTDIETRVQKIAPFLSYDHDPYTAIVDGRLVWIWDAYTTSDSFPYSESNDLAAEAGADGGTLPTSGNYVRNSVKVVIDAYDGTSTFYIVDPDDPVIEAWSQVFPDLFTSGDSAPDELRAHFRYPEDLFRIQSHMYANYHVTTPPAFYAKEDFWEIPQILDDPTARAEEEGAAAENTHELEPYYVLLPLPGEEEATFRLFVPFTPLDRPNMVAWVAASSDPETYGDLTSYEFQEQNVIGPSQVTSFISQDTEVSQQVSLFDQLGSNVIYGDLLAIPIGQSFLYVQPVYLESQGGSAIPELKRVVVVTGGNVEMAENLTDALAEAFGGAETPTEPDPEEPTDGEPPPEATADQLLIEALEHFAAADAARLAGDLGTYQQENEAGVAALREFAELTGQAPPTDAGASPTPETSPQS